MVKSLSADTMGVWSRSPEEGCVKRLSFDRVAKAEWVAPTSNVEGEEIVLTVWRHRVKLYE